MKKLFFLIVVSYSVLSYVSCVSTSVEDSSQIKVENEKTGENKSARNKLDEKKSAEKEFIDYISGIQIKVVSSPATTTKNKSFAAPFVVAVTKEDKPLADFSVDVSFPVARINDEISFEVKTMTTDSEGRISFIPETPNFSCDNYVYFYPTPLTSDDNVVAAAKNISASAAWKVRTNLTSPQSMIYVFDYGASGRPGNNSFTMLRALRNLGFNMGNAPINDSSYLSRSTEDLYKTTRNIVGNSFSFMVSGTVKYSEPVQQVEDGYKCSLIAKIQCIDMSNGNVIYETEREHTEVRRNEQTAINDCREALSQKIATSIYYAL